MISRVTSIRSQNAVSDSRRGALNHKQIHAVRARSAVVGTSLVVAVATLVSSFFSVSASATPMPRATANPLSFGVPSPTASARVAAAATSSASAKPVSTGFAPDPPAVTTREQWKYEINIRDGELFVASPTRADHAVAVATPRRFGRFAIELYVGETLLERVRFDVPMMSDDPEAGPKATRFDKKARGKVVVEVPNVERTTFAVLVDRSTGRKKRIPWLPVDGIQKVAIPEPAPRSDEGHARGLCAPEPVR